MACSKEFYAKDRKNHEENLAKLCVQCLDRNKVRPLNDNLKKLVAKWLYPDFFKDEKYLPSSICGTHRMLLLSKAKGKQAMLESS